MHHPANTELPDSAVAPAHHRLSTALLVSEVAAVAVTHHLHNTDHLDSVAAALAHLPLNTELQVLEAVAVVLHLPNTEYPDLEAEVLRQLSTAHQEVVHRRLRNTALLVLEVVQVVRPRNTVLLEAGLRRPVNMERPVSAVEAVPVIPLQAPGLI